MKSLLFSIVCYVALAGSMLAQSPTANISVTMGGQTYSGTATLTLPVPTCVAPSYACADSGTEIVQTPTPPFSATTPVNTIVRESVLSQAHLSRVTGRTTGNGACGTSNQWNATESGGSSDVISNVNGTLISITCSGGVSYIVGFNPQTLQMYPAPPAPFVTGMSCIGGLTFSRANPLVAYCRQTTKLNKITFALAPTSNLCGLGVGQCPDVSVSPTWTQAFDFSGCTSASSANPTWSSLLSVGPNDATFIQALSWTGNQGTARYTFAYVPGVGCSTFDSQGNGSNPAWYNAQGQQSILTGVNATWFVHDVTTNGAWAQISATGCVGKDCLYDGPPSWEVNTNGMIMFSTMPFAQGHNSYSKDYFLSEANPGIYKFSLANPTAAPVQIANLLCPGNVGTTCTDAHFNANVNDDTSPILGTTWKLDGPWLAPYRNEVFGATVDGSGKMFQFCKTYSSGAATTGFQAQEGVGAPNQPRNVYFFTSDMLGTLGKTATGLNEWDVFACALVGQ